MPETTWTEADVAEMANNIATALQDFDAPHDVFWEEDGGEGWHITVSAGEQIPIDGGGCDPEFSLTFWTRSDEWLWGCVSKHHERSGPWPARELDAGSGVAEVVEFVTSGLRAYSHAGCTDEDCAEVPR